MLNFVENDVSSIGYTTANIYDIKTTHNDF